ncbi:dynamin family protein [Aspergillus saccharolyticus JOP 1030-1]|uniref:Vacuolar sorting protein VPS1, dynamin n=1 Tax=Aspergillus saccharolyticus JOP 1030-1 TaxID=1450539 RepID=A0A318ZEI3_9EURO|nr:hypothetical protein BP01DRAFT_356151 [Aspergillus saccharolyticus JOP 1030-1]PYH45956.1 hypothetical protein BP01DRAFT_356151 [Aspergillus saccharolyticus JOP 1030-1]
MAFRTIKCPTEMTQKVTPGYAKLADPALLDKIDSLFACNVGEYIDLPQLVVVGDQSSGKSSVLEGLTRLPFPRDSGLCTRFASQLIFRRDKSLTIRKIHASIIPASESDATRAGELKAWDADFEGDLSAAAFADTMKKVHALMGVSTDEEPGRPTFSNDVFRLEICGPEEDHLSVIDVPGIFRSATSSRIAKADIPLVRNMVLGYMRNPRSIMLTVVAANVDVANQEIIEMARELDPDGERTLGVLTKPDLVDEGAEQKIVDIVAGHNLPLKHGWILVRNLSQLELEEGKVDRDIAEAEYGKKKFWNTVAADRYGIGSLKARLQETVTENARKAFPLVRAEINKKLSVAKASLLGLGDERESTSQQFKYLLDAVTKFGDMTTQALSTNYGANEEFEKHPGLRLATIIVNRDDAFSQSMEKWGHKYSFQVDTINVNSVLPAAPDEYYPATQSTRLTEDILELDDIITNCEEVDEPLPYGIYQWLKEEYHKSRGFDLNTFQSSLLANVFRSQTMKWESIAIGYLSDIIASVHTFILRGLELCISDKRVFLNLVPYIMDDITGKYRDAIEQVRLLLHIERRGTLKTLNHYFNDNLQKIRQERWEAYLQTQMNKYGVVETKKLSYQQNMSNESHTVQDLHDILKAYYRVAMKRFVDNVSMQAADYHLVHGPKTPMKVLSPSFVHSFSPEQLQEIAGEDPSVGRRRAHLKKQIRELEEGKKLLV